MIEGTTLYVASNYNAAVEAYDVACTAAPPLARSSGGDLAAAEECAGVEKRYRIYLDCVAEAEECRDLCASEATAVADETEESGCAVDLRP